MNELEVVNVGSLVKVEQLPIIIENLRAVKEKIETEVNSLLALECNEDTYKDVKKSRAEMNKVKTAFEDKRKEIKNEIMKPYNDFEAVYKECVSDPLNRADGALKGKIEAVECELKAAKQTEVEAYYNEYCQFVGVDFVPFEKSGIKVTMTDSTKKLKEGTKAFLDKIAAEIETISAMDNSAEIMTEYRSTLNMASSIQTVIARNKAVAEEKARVEARAAAEAERKAAEAKVEQVIGNPLEAPTEATKPAEEPKYKTTFTITATIDKIRKVKDFLEKEGINYEC